MVHKRVSEASQTNAYDLRNVANFSETLLDKCNEIQSFYKHAHHELQHGRELINTEEKKLDKMLKSVGVFEEQVDALGVKLLRCNADVSRKNTEIDQLKTQIAAKKGAMAQEHLPQFESKYLKQERLQELKTERQELELLLHKVNLDIEQTYEEVFEAEERLNGLKELRAQRKDEETRYMENLKEKTDNVTSTKEKLLGVADRGRVDMSKIYASQEDFHRLEIDIDKIKQEQMLITLNIKSQTKERDYLREVSQDIFQRLYNLEKKALKLDRAQCVLNKPTDPNLYQDLSGPSVWYTSPPLTVLQLKKLQEDHHWKYSHVGETIDRSTDETITSQNAVDINKVEDLELQ